MGGGDPGPTQSTTYTSNLPEYARPYYEHMLTTAEQEVNQPYTPYGGQRQAQSTPFMNAYYSGISNMGPAYPILEGQDLTRGAANQAASRTGYAPGTISNQYNPNQYNSGWGNFDAAAAAQYMSPYQQYVTDLQKQSAVTDYGRQRNARNDAAFKANAFGGGRHAVMEALGEEGLLNRMNTIQGQGLQDAYGNAQSQFERDRASGINNAQFGAGFGDQSQQYWNNQNMQAQTQNEQNRQAAEAIGLNWNTAAMQGGQQLGQLGDQFQTSELTRLGQIGQAGQLQQSQAQQALDQQYQDFVNQRDYGRNNVSFISSILHGLPTGVNSQSDTIGYTNPAAQALGLGIGAAGLSKSLSS